MAHTGTWQRIRLGWLGRPRSRHSSLLLIVANSFAPNASDGKRADSQSLRNSKGLLMIKNYHITPQNLSFLVQKMEAL
jgi:hypothetical protein